MGCGGMSVVCGACMLYGFGGMFVWNVECLLNVVECCGMLWNGVQCLMVVECCKMCVECVMCFECCGMFADVCGMLILIECSSWRNVCGMCACGMFIGLWNVDICEMFVECMWKVDCLNNVEC